MLNASERARIPTQRDAGWQARAVWVARRSPPAEAFRNLALRLCEQAPDGRFSLLVTSALPGEGKTLTSCNLALALGSLAGAERVALVDFDLRVPGVGPALGLTPKEGIEAVLRADAPLHQAVIETEAAVDVFPVARAVPDAHELLVTGQVGGILRQLESRYRWVICDSPPLFPVPDVPLLLGHVGSCLAVVRAGRTPRAVLPELAERIPRNKLVGFFLNDGWPPAHMRRYYRSAYYGNSSGRAAW